MLYFRAHGYEKAGTNQVMDPYIQKSKA
jgi:hypothetical protein